MEWTEEQDDVLREVSFYGADYAAEESSELEAVRRERDAIRQRNVRLCKKYGLQSKRQRKREMRRRSQ